jgi:hypothetical protein
MFKTSLGVIEQTSFNKISFIFATWFLVKKYASGCRAELQLCLCSVLAVLKTCATLHETVLI